MRFIKQFLYGLFYLSIFAGIGASVYFVFLKPVPSCFDNILNQLETEVDCGPDVGVTPGGPFTEGGCIPCELKTLEVVVGEPKAFTLSDTTSSLAVLITNPSVNYGLKKFNYTYDVYAPGNIRLRTIAGESSLYPSEKKYLVFSGLDIAKSRISRVEIKLGEINWMPKAMLPSRPSVDITNQKVSQSQLAGPIEVTGSVNNNSPVRLGPLQVTALGYDSSGFLSATSTYEIDQLLDFSSANFRIFLPAPPPGQAPQYLKIETQLEISQ